MDARPPSDARTRARRSVSRRSSMVAGLAARRPALSGCRLQKHRRLMGGDPSAPRSETTVRPSHSLENLLVLFAQDDLNVVSLYRDCRLVSHKANCLGEQIQSGQF